MAKAGALHAICWVAQFLGHGLAEKRAPALVDNLFAGQSQFHILVLFAVHWLELMCQAVVLAPFFVHLEILFSLGYNPGLHKQVQNGIGQEIARVRKLEAIKKRAVGKKQ
jgi:2-hydroxy fatty acid dioxygenase